MTTSIATTTKSTILRSNSIENEYYFGDLPGTLQYKIDVSDIKNLEIDFSETNTCGFTIEPFSHENFMRVIPNTKTGNSGTWNCILLMKKEVKGTGMIWLKAALENLKTGKIALMTSTNNKGGVNRAIKSMDPNWFVGHYRMSAPMVFWKELKYKLEKLDKQI